MPPGLDLLCTYHHVELQLGVQVQQLERNCQRVKESEHMHTVVHAASVPSSYRSSPVSVHAVSMYRNSSVSKRTRLGVPFIVYSAGPLYQVLWHVPLAGYAVRHTVTGQTARVQLTAHTGASACGDHAALSRLNDTCCQWYLYSCSKSRRRAHIRTVVVHDMDRKTRRRRRR